MHPIKKHTDNDNLEEAVALDESGIGSDYAIFEVTENGAKAVNIIRNDECSGSSLIRH